MEFIQHRVNEIVKLKDIPKEYGVEIDLRSDVKRPSFIHLAHDPWRVGDSFLAWLEEFKRAGISGRIILNTKEDGLEAAVYSLLEQFEIKNFLFLDTVLPTLARYVIQGKGKDFFVRHSMFEPRSFVEIFRGKVDWVWVDCFEGKPVDEATVRALRSHFRTCLVSPELQHKDISEISKFRELSACMDAICTKNPTVWKAELGGGPGQRL